MGDAGPGAGGVAPLPRGEWPAFRARRGPALRERLIGLGVAMPGQIFAWTDVMGLDPAELVDWNEVDISSLISEIARLPVETYNDATAACAGEMVLGSALTFANALYVYVGTFIGGGVVINGQLFEGPRRNAGAIGSMPVTGKDGSEQLIRHASLYSLENRLRSKAIGDLGMIAERARDPSAAKAYAEWRRTAAPAIAQAVTAAVSVIDFEGVVIDANLYPPQLEALVHDVQEALRHQDLTGISPFALRQGSIGPRARVSGAAILPLIREFSPDQYLLVKRVASAA